MALLFNTLSRFVIAFLPRGKCLLISVFKPTHFIFLQLQTLLKKKKRHLVLSKAYQLVSILYLELCQAIVHNKYYVFKHVKMYSTLCILFFPHCIHIPISCLFSS